jgi:23S rRNA (pseudouridine1915-N3)-methyltransferase
VRLVIVAVGQRVPDWAQTAWDDYAKRFPYELKVELKAVKTEPRGSKTVEALVAAERGRIEAALPKGCRIVAPDGLHPAFKQAAHERIRLSDLTLPHAMVRVLLIEQLYRAWSINANHPYHRE